VVYVWAGKLRTMLIFIPAGLDDILSSVDFSNEKRSAKKNARRKKNVRRFSGWRRELSSTFKTSW